MAMKFEGCPYPIMKHPRGLLHTQSGVEQIKSDMLVLLLTNPGERVMLPDFGTPLRDLIFDQNDADVETRARDMIIRSIRQWEPRVKIESVEVGVVPETPVFDSSDTGQNEGHILGIRIMFVDPENIREVQQLRLELPLAGGQ